MVKLNRCAEQSLLQYSLQARSLSPIKGQARGSSTARVERGPSEGARSASKEGPRACPFLLSLPISSSREGGLLDLPLRATFSPAHLLARRAVPRTRARAFQSSSPLVEGVAEAALYCAHRTSTFLSCAFREREDDQATLLLHPLRRIFLPRFFLCEPSIQGRQDHQREDGRGKEAADHYSCKRPLDFGADPLREGQRQQTH